VKLDDVRKLHQKKYREQSGRFLVEGEHLVLELQKAAQRRQALRDARLYVTRAHAGWQSPFATQVVSDLQMARISDTHTPQGLVAVVPMLPAPAPRPGERAVYLHEVQDPGNLGTILRTLAWFGGFRCLLGPGSVDPYNPKAVRASMGAIFHVPFETDVGPAALRERYPRIACLDLQGEPVTSPSFARHDCYLFGNEARGLPEDTAASLGAARFTVPGGGAIESLNLAAVVGICAYELSR
jgi:TrmH family RNA methyltransferase